MAEAVDPDNVEEYECLFDIALNKEAFVDKSMLIKEIFDPGRRLLITAPCRFIKSTNLDMIKQFLSINGSPDVDTPNYTLEKFKNLKIYENNSHFFRTNFQKHPVLFVSFSAGIVSSYDDALDSYRWALHTAYNEHFEFMEEQLGSLDIDMFRGWKVDRFMEMEEVDIMNGLSRLVYLMRKAYRKEVVVLIDDFDNVVNNALINDMFPLEDIERVGELTSIILKAALKDNRRVSVAVLTGESVNTTAPFVAKDLFERFPFLGNHKFVEFFGFTEQEVIEDIMPKYTFEDRDRAKELVKSRFGGYKNESGVHILHPAFVLNYFDQGEKGLDWQPKGHITKLVLLTFFPKIARCIYDLLEKETVLFARQTMLLPDLLHLKRSLQTPGNIFSDEVYTSTILSYAFEQGIVVFDPKQIICIVEIDDDDVPIAKLQLPNEEIRKQLAESFMAHVKIECIFPPFFETGYYNYGEFIKHVKGLTGDKWTSWMTFLWGDGS